MIIGSLEKMKVGQRDKGIADVNQIRHEEQPFIVLREATAEEWYDEAIADGMSAEKASRVLAMTKGAKFYEVSVD